MNTLEERRQAYAEKILTENDDKQWQSAFKRQEDLGYDFNLMALISGISSACTISNVAIPSKTKACQDALDELWNEKHRRVAENDLNLDYSSFGSLPYTYSEIRAEAETL